MTEELPLTPGIVSAKERHKKLREDADRAEKEQAEKFAAQQTRDAERHKAAAAEAIKREEKFIDNVALVSSNETRENLYARIQALRDRKPANAEVIYPVVPLTARMQAQHDEEIARGQEVQKRHEAQQAANREAQAKYAREEAARNAGNPLNIPNPTQKDVFPTVGATLPGSK